VTTVAPPRVVLSDLGPIAQLRAGRLGRRLVQLYAGLLLYGFSIALMVRSHLGLAPWDVLHSGLTEHFPIDIGQALVIVSFVVMLAWIPLREMPGLGTISNAIVIGVSADVFLAVLATPQAIAGVPGTPCDWCAPRWSSPSWRSVCSSEGSPGSGRSCTPSASVR
jgi:hypothetical protein